MLRASGIHKSFGSVKVLTGVDLSVKEGEIVGLLGPNGSGKTTLLNVLSGFLPLSSGQANFDGRDISGFSSHRISQLGMRRTFQLPRMPSKMSCAEVLLTSVDQPAGRNLWSLFTKPGAVRSEIQQAKLRVAEMLDILGLHAVADRPASALSGGQQKLVALGAAVLGGAKLLLLDEPTAGVNPSLRVKLIDNLKMLRDRGVTLIVVEHDMGFVGRLCERCVVLDQGKMIADCPPADLMNHESVVEAYLGKGAAATLVRSAGIVN
ncbi:amino acid ABC transporter ATP-binding protein [Brucella anthropi]|uniref:ABC transporter ATP-binding protein n=1 Tax=Brucella anthropi TaxID=529 RepID=UPI000451FE9D|nr:ABC transporter ATP-binding protein [Brucella anthropi]EXL06506.1 amino acid ABC transporter ATP-binding protein [Brucella anthropi]